VTDQPRNERNARTTISWDVDKQGREGWREEGGDMCKYNKKKRRKSEESVSKKRREGGEEGERIDMKLIEGRRGRGGEDIREES